MVSKAIWTFAWTITTYLLYKIYNAAISRGTKRYTGILGVILLKDNNIFSQLYLFKVQNNGLRYLNWFLI